VFFSKTTSRICAQFCFQGLGKNTYPLQPASKSTAPTNLQWAVASDWKRTVQVCTLYRRICSVAHIMRV